MEDVLKGQGMKKKMNKSIKLVLTILAGGALSFAINLCFDSGWATIILLLLFLGLYLLFKGGNRAHHSEDWSELDIEDDYLERLQKKEEEEDEFIRQLHEEHK